eukprot:1666447-Pleurochrysis_carterae.AAC.1
MHRSERPLHAALGEAVACSVSRGRCMQRIERPLHTSLREAVARSTQSVGRNSCTQGRCREGGRARTLKRGVGTRGGRSALCAFAACISAIACFVCLCAWASAACCAA